MTNLSLAENYIRKARNRLAVLSVLVEAGDFSDVVRESQEAVELALKGMLRRQGIEPPKWHDVGGLLTQHAVRFPEPVRGRLERLAADSAWLREERELAFYGDVDFIPSEEYDRADAERAVEAARFAVESAEALLGSAEG